MLTTCEEYASENNLKFSTDANPARCKTKCLAFTFKKRELKQMMLCGNPLPWVDKCKHLGNYLESRYEGLKQDLRTKRAEYINKNNELEQELYFCHPQTKFDVNKIYNSHFTGSPLWKEQLGQSLLSQNHLFLRFLLLNNLNRTALKLRSSSNSFFLRLSSIFHFY